MHLITEIAEDLAKPGEHKRLLAAFPSIASDGRLVDVVFAYAYELPGQRGRYFVHRQLALAPASARMGEYRTAAQALKACAYFNGFGGSLPNRIDCD